MDIPVTQAVRVLRENKVGFEPLLFEYVEKGGTRHSSQVLGVDEHTVVKTLIFETSEKKPLAVLMHGDLMVSTKNLARHIGVKAVEPAKPERASQLTGYIVGGTSPFGLRTKMPVYAEETVFDLETIYINGGKRGFLVAIDPKDLERILQVERVRVGIGK